MKTLIPSAWLLAPFIVVGLAGNAAAASGDDGAGALAISPPTQSVEAFAEEWRRVRSLMRGCGAPDTAMRPIGFTENFLVDAKATAARARGEQVSPDLSSYSFADDDEIDASRETCTKVGQELRQILRAVTRHLQCKGPISTIAQTPDCPTPIYRAPRF